MNREPIHVALFALVTACGSFATKSRILRHWTDVPSAEMPAAFLAHKKDGAIYAGKGMPPKWTMTFDVYFYVESSNPDVPPSTMMNSIMDALEAALAGSPADPFNQTLGGLVSHCRIGGGDIQTDEGTLGNLSVTIVPIEIVL